jgi:hypothetical protein
LPTDTFNVSSRGDRDYNKTQPLFNHHDEPEAGGCQLDRDVADWEKSKLREVSNFWRGRQIHADSADGQVKK